MRSVLTRRAVLTLTVCLAPFSSARAHPIVDEARARLEAGDLEDVLTVLGAVDGATDFTRDDLLAVFVYRATALHALGNDDGAFAELTKLASLEPTYALDASHAPSLREALDRARAAVEGPIQVVAATESFANRVRFTATATGDIAELVRAIQVRVEEAGGLARTHLGASVEVQRTSGGALRYQAEAIGPGGAIVASTGWLSIPAQIADSPSHLLTPTQNISQPTDVRRESERTERTNGRTWLWVALGTGAAIAVASVAVVFATRDPATRIEGPVYPPRN